MPKTLKQSYRPTYSASVSPQPLEQSKVTCPKEGNAERPVRHCFRCDSCGGLTLTTVDCNYHDKGGDHG